MTKILIELCDTYGDLSDEAKHLISSIMREPYDADQAQASCASEEDAHLVEEFFDAIRSFVDSKPTFTDHASYVARVHDFIEDDDEDDVTEEDEKFLDPDGLVNTT